MALFEYYKRLYLMAGDNFLNVNGKLLVSWWNTLSYEDKKQANMGEYMFWNLNRNCWTFTEKVFKELEQDV